MNWATHPSSRIIICCRETNHVIWSVLASLQQPITAPSEEKKKLSPPPELITRNAYDWDDLQARVMFNIKFYGKELDDESSYYRRIMKLFAVDAAKGMIQAENKWKDVRWYKVDPHKVKFMDVTSEPDEQKDNVVALTADGPDVTELFVMRRGAWWLAWPKHRAIQEGQTWAVNDRTEGHLAGTYDRQNEENTRQSKSYLLSG